MNKLYHVTYVTVQTSTRIKSYESSIISTDSKVHDYFDDLNRVDTDYTYNLDNYVEVSERQAKDWCCRYDRAVIPYKKPENICEYCGKKLNNGKVRFRTKHYCNTACALEFTMNSSVGVDIISNTVKAECECIDI